MWLILFNTKKRFYGDALEIIVFQNSNKKLIIEY